MSGKIGTSWPGGPAGAGPRAPLSVMSYNIQGHGALVGRRYLAGVARVIRRARPQVVGLQEVHRGTWAARFDDQVRILAELTGMTAAFGRSLRLRRGEYGNAVLTRGRLLEEEVEILPGEAERRSLLRCRIALGSAWGSAPVDVYVTHLAAWGRFGRGVRIRQARHVAARLEASRHPYVLTGDLNAPPGAPELAPLVSSPCGERRTGLPGPTHRLTRQCIDYVLPGPGWRAVRAEVLRAGPSDHYPVLASLWPDARTGVSPEPAALALEAQRAG